MARTAVVAGTAQAVSGRMATRQRTGASERAERQAAEHERRAGRRSKTRPGLFTDEIVDQLKKLAELRDAGVLTEKEFAAKKAKLLP